MRAKLHFPIYSAMLALTFAACGKDKGQDSSEPSVQPKAHSENTKAAPPNESKKAPESEGTWYRATFDMGKSTPHLAFFLRLPSENGIGLAVNGEEKKEFQVSVTGEQITIDADWNYPSKVIATRASDGTLKGQFKRYIPMWGDVIIPFAATPIDSPDPKKRYPGKAEAKADGYWKFEFEHHGQGQGEFVEKDGALTGWVRPGSLSDLRYMAGNVVGKTMTLSTYNGNIATVLSADISDDGKTMSGVMNMGGRWVEKFSANRVEALPPAKLVQLKKGKKSLSFAGDERIKGKPSLVVLFATWCNGCNDSMTFVSQMAKKYEAKGVKVLGLAYEFTEDKDAIDEQLAIFRKKYKIEFETIGVPSTPEGFGAAVPQELSGLDGLPVFAFIDKSGTVKHLWGGWYGPAAPAKNAQLRADFENWLSDIADS